MAKTRLWGNWEPENEKGNMAIMCPGCEIVHIIPTKIPLHNGAIWQFNGDCEKPTFTPSLAIKTGSYARADYIDPPELTPVICHSNITDGMIQFHGDSTHHLSGQTVELPDIKDTDL